MTRIQVAFVQYNACYTFLKKRNEIDRENIQKRRQYLTKSRNNQNFEPLKRVKIF